MVCLCFVFTAYLAGYAPGGLLCLLACFWVVCFNGVGVCDSYDVLF